MSQGQEQQLPPATPARRGEAMLHPCRPCPGQEQELLRLALWHSSSCWHRAGESPCAPIELHPPLNPPLHAGYRDSSRCLHDAPCTTSRDVTYPLYSSLSGVKLLHSSKDVARWEPNRVGREAVGCWSWSVARQKNYLRYCCKKHPGTSNDQQAVRSRLSQLTSRQEMIYNTKGEVKALPEQSVRSTH